MEKNNIPQRNENDSNKNKDTNINEDTYLNIKDNKNQSSYSKVNNFKEKEENNYNKKIKEDNSNKKIGTLNKRKPYYFYRKLGNTITFFGDKNASPLIVIGPHWPMYFCCCTIVTIFFSLFFKNFWIHINIIFKIMGIITFLTFFISYSYTSLINPGIPKYDENAILGKPRENYRYCAICCIWINIEENTSHCFDCNICYEGYDHHCPWTGKCIAKKNVNTFYVFLVSILCTFCYFVTALTHAQHNIFINSKKNKKF